MIGIVTINYLNWKDTLELITTIENQQNIDYRLVIVDNCSNNNSVEEIKKKIIDNPNIELIVSEENIGFAKGNNLGIDVLLKRNIRKILLLNNDTLLKNNDFLKKLSTIKYKEDVGAIGTRIIGSDGVNQNPVWKNVTLKQVQKEKKMIEKEISAFDKKIPYFLFRVERFIKRKVEGHKKKERFFLHGSALLLTENYFKLFKGLYPDTFLYYEEDILYLIFQKFSLEFKYFEDLELYHKEDQSSIIAWSGNSKPKLLYLSDSINKAIELVSMKKSEIFKIMGNSDSIKSEVKDK